MRSPSPAAAHEPAAGEHVPCVSALKRSAPSWAGSHRFKARRGVVRTPHILRLNAPTAVFLCDGSPTGLHSSEASRRPRRQS